VDILLPPALTVSILLEGEIDATLDGAALSVGGADGPRGQLLFHRQPARLRRRLNAGARVRKVNVSISPDAIGELLCQDETAGVPEIFGFDAFFAETWLPSRRSIRLAEGILEAERERYDLCRLSMAISALA